MIFLVWQVLVPGMTPVHVNYLNGAKDLMMPANAGFTGLRATLTSFRLDEYIESTIELTAMPSMNLNGTVLQCTSENRQENITVLTDLSGL